MMTIIANSCFQSILSRVIFCVFVASELFILFYFIYKKPFLVTFHRLQQQQKIQNMEIDPRAAALQDLRIQSFDTIRFASYRTACKLRYVQKATNCKSKNKKKKFAQN